MFQIDNAKFIDIIFMSGYVIKKAQIDRGNVVGGEETGWMQYYNNGPL